MSRARNFPDLQVLGPIAVTATPKTLDLKLVDDFRLPASYCEFASRFGYGLLCGLLLIYIPMGNKGDSLPVRYSELKTMLDDSMEQGLFEYEPVGSPELVKRLVPFGISENGHTLAWDPDDSTGPRERMIYVVGSKTLAVRKGAPDLYSLVAGVLDERVKGMLGPGYRPLAPTFKPLRAR